MPKIKLGPSANGQLYPSPSGRANPPGEPLFIRRLGIRRRARRYGGQGDTSPYLLKFLYVKLLLNKSIIFAAATLICLSFLISGCEDSKGHLADGHDFGSNNPTLYVAFGDSITYGTGVADADNYPTKLAGMMMRTVINEGYPGAASGVGADLVQDILNQYKPGFLLILFGVNDLIMDYGEEEAIQNLQYICQAAINNKTIPVIATLTPVAGEHHIWASGVDNLNVLIRELAANMKVAIVDLDIAFNWDTTTYLQADGLHPNVLGYNLMAVTFYDVVN